MRQQMYEKALKDIRDTLIEAKEQGSLYAATDTAVTIINTVLQGVDYAIHSDMMEYQRGAAMRREKANNNSGQ